MSKKVSISFELILWILYVIVIGLAVFAWGSDRAWNFTHLSSLTIFPLFGLSAFSIMWVHYISGFIRDTWFPVASTKRSFMITSFAVLALILLHPTLLAYGLWQHGAGLPPGSYKQYVGAAGTLYILFAELALAGFLLFEFRRWFKNRDWWKYIAAVNDVAAVLIMVHSLKLGHDIQRGWFLYVWYFYCITILGCIVRNYYVKLNQEQVKSET